MDSERVDGYLARIGVDRPRRADAEALRDLQDAHLRTVPFENLSIHLGEEIVLEEQPLWDKVVARHRGGFCYELNGLFAALLSALGFPVTLLAARVWSGPERLGPPFDHLALRVEARGPWLVDVGFGSFSQYPLRLDEPGDQADPGGRFRVVEGEYGERDVLQGGEPQYRLEPRPRELAEFAPTCWYHRTCPASHFTRSLTCSLATDDGRITLSGRRLIRTVHGARQEQKLSSDAEVLAAYRTWFGITLDRVPTVR